MFITKTHHYHDFKKLIFIKESGTALNGVFVDRIILSRECTCGQAQAFECGPKDKMRALYKKLVQ